MLCHVAYIGRIPWNGETHEGKHEAIVSQELWEAVQERLETGQRGPRQATLGRIGGF
jgi:hypothetical protein